MDPLEKKRLANERRLKAVQQWQKQRTQQVEYKLSQDDFGLKVTNQKKNNLKLFDSDDEEDDNAAADFNIRPQFEGQNGLHLLEMSSEFSDRFKLDERFKDDEPTEMAVPETREEKVKNIKILESILGYEVCEKYPGKINGIKKRAIKRFDPEDESSSKYIKSDEVSKEEKPKKKHREKKEAVEIKEIVPTSNERYIEVTSNLKDLLISTSSPFTLASKFQSTNDKEDEIPHEFRSPFAKKETQATETSNFPVKSYSAQHQKKDVFESRNVYTFFISEDDSRLKEGVEFFMRPKPLEEIRDEWNSRKDYVTELFRTKKRSSQRRYVNKRPTTQGKRTFIKQ